MEVPQTIKQEKVDYGVTEPDVNFETIEFMEIKFDHVKTEPHSNLLEPNNLAEKCNLMEGTPVIRKNDEYMFDPRFDHSLNELSKQQVSEIKFEEGEIEKMEDTDDVKWEIEDKEVNIKDEVNIKEQEQSRSLYIYNMDLPKSFNHIAIDKNKYRVDIKKEEDIYKWMDEYKSIYFSSWRATNTKKNTPHFVFSVIYICHHSDFRRIPPDKNKKGKSKNSNCRAKIKISIKHTTKDTIKKDKFVKDGLPGIISIIDDHNHSLESAESLSYLRPSSNTRAKFITYFDSGMGIKESLNYHQSKLELEFGFDSKLLANAEINPKYRTVQHWHDIWRRENLGPRNGVIKEDITINKNGIPDEKQEYSFADFVNTLKDKNVELGTSLPTLKILQERLSHIKTKTAWESFLNTLGSSFARRFGQKSSIRLQPTSIISRRKLGITRGSKRLPFVRPAKGEPAKKKVKRRHNFSANTAANHANAAKHGERR